MADRLAAAIANGVYQHGERLPSVRELMASEGVSQSTAVRAMIEIEALGLAVSRSRSGFYARRPPLAAKSAASSGLLDIPAATLSSDEASAVTIQHLIQDLFRAFKTPGLVALGAADVAKSLLPTAELTSAMKRAVRIHGPTVFQTAGPYGVQELRRAIAILLQRRGLSISTDDVIVTGGETDAMALALRAVTRPGQAVAVESPTFFGVLQVIEEAGLRAIEIATHPITGIDLVDLIRAADQNKFQAVVLNPTFENPFGCCMEPDALRAVAEAMTQRAIPIIEDDVYSDLNFRGRPVKALASFDRAGNTIYCGSFSKVLSPGLRVGWCVPGKYRAKIMDLQARRPATVSTLSQFTLVEYLSGRRYAKHVAKLTDIFARQRNAVRQLIKDHFPEGTTATIPDGGFLFWIEVPPPFDVMRFYRRALAAGISIAPGPIFSASGRFPHAFRLSVGRRLTPEVRRAIRMLGELAKT
ncbi:DNA-binding transcriptional MocR family regulator [Rhodopseudomonas rhenobacensis]|uniref:DNA-binding transcriptional MocR family regulator n=1 Tax=Rhodopseudomonas rhenobacensis TaxID=87461 RepID=A0A7W8E1K2_9BRAD|nr:PLP-dependent aminotransferase family protein [Rhodopseudomonas rhenobacensis]MBB5048981.1 DNA-binding transcriptional MocR family regulator [Rhodopseudomonas rhenobacensis]